MRRMNGEKVRSKGKADWLCVRPSMGSQALCYVRRFGYTKGAFIDALKDRHGLLRTADQGVLFLDEIGELGLDELATLLRALEEKRFCRSVPTAKVRAICNSSLAPMAVGFKPCRNGAFAKMPAVFANIWHALISTGPL